MRRNAFTGWSAFVLAGAAVFAFSNVVRAADKVPAPSEADASAALKLVKETFKQEYAARGVTAQSALAKLLIKHAASETRGSATRFVMLREAASISGMSGDYPAASDAVTELESEFEIDGVPLRTKALTDAAAHIKSASEAVTIAEAALQLAESAVAHGDYDIAVGDLSKVAERAGALTKDKELTARVHESVRSFRAARDESHRSAEAAKTLEFEPDDPKANLEVGKFLCFFAGRWDEGLPKLAKSGDVELSTMAKRDIAGASEPEQRVTLGDNWHALGAAQAASRRDGYDRRAEHWYELALADTKGIMRTRIFKKMAGLPGGTSFDALRLAMDKNPERGNEHPEDPGLLVGFRYSYGGWAGHRILKQLQPVWLTARGQIAGRIIGVGADQLSTALIAKPGYAVGAVVIDTTDRVNGLKLVFMRSRGVALDPGDAYDSPWIGDHVAKAPATLGGNGNPVIGLQSISGSDVDKLDIHQLE